MKYLTKILLVFLTANSFSQPDTTVLVIPMRNDFINFDKHVGRIFKQNKIPSDSAKHFIQQSSIDRLNISFPKYSFINLQSINEYKFLIDSISVSEQWTSLQYEKLNGSHGLKKIFTTNENRSRFKYFGRSIRDDHALILKALIIKYDLKYIFLINKFEIASPFMFSDKTRFSIHFDIYDKSLNRIFGGKSSWSAETSSTMYYSAFCLYLRKAIDSFYEQTKSSIK